VNRESIEGLFVLVTGAHIGASADGRGFDVRAAMFLAMYSASLLISGRTSEDTAYWKTKPMKYRPGSPSTTPRR
jgi:hypothetical protein